VLAGRRVEQMRHADRVVRRVIRNQKRETAAEGSAAKDEIPIKHRYPPLPSTFIDAPPFA
jgi:hypothetical protein